MQKLSLKSKAPAVAAPRSLEKPLRIILIAAGIIGLLCAFIITDDKMRLLANPNFPPNCNLNPVISCGSVMQSKQSNAFGFSNPYLGLAAFPALATVGVAMLAGATFKRWFWVALQAGALAGVVFVHWLFFQSVYRIGALCPYCMVVWIATITTFWYLLLYNLERGTIRLGQRHQAITDVLRRHHLDILILWLLIIGALILKHFWYYYGQYV